MARPYDWFPLAASDPVPGDVDAVKRSGQDYTAVAKAIESLTIQDDLKIELGPDDGA